MGKTSFYKARLGGHTNIEFSILLHNFDRQAQPELWTVTKSKSQLALLHRVLNYFQRLTLMVKVISFCGFSL